MSKSDSMTHEHLARLLRLITISAEDMRGLRLLYKNQAGFSFVLDKKNVPQGETIPAARTIGCAIRDQLGDDFGSSLGINYIGYCDRSTGHFRMKANVRGALDSLQWFKDPAQSDVGQQRPTTFTSEITPSEESASGPLGLDPEATRDDKFKIGLRSFFADRASGQSGELDEFVVTHARDAQFESGLQPFFEYRDLGIKTATHGRFTAHLIRSKGREASTQAHLHQTDFLMVYVLKGWVEFEYAGQGVVRLEAGSCVYQPSGIGHRELAHSEDLEMLEVVMPADFVTENFEGVNL